MNDERIDSGQTEDEALMREYSGGSTAAFEQLYGRYRERLFTYLLHQTSSRPVAEDAFQEVFVRIIRSRLSYQADGSFAAYLFTIARNVVIDNRRRRAVRRERETRQT